MRTAALTPLETDPKENGPESFASLSPQQMWALAFFTLGNPLRGFPFSRAQPLPAPLRAAPSWPGSRPPRGLGLAITPRALVRWRRCVMAVYREADRKSVV